MFLHLRRVNRRAAFATITRGIIALISGNRLPLAIFVNTSPAISDHKRWTGKALPRLPEAQLTKRRRVRLPRLVERSREEPTRKLTHAFHRLDPNSSFVSRAELVQQNRRESVKIDCQFKTLHASVRYQSNCYSIFEHIFLQIVKVCFHILQNNCVRWNMLHRKGCVILYLSS